MIGMASPQGNTFQTNLNRPAADHLPHLRPPRPMSGIADVLMLPVLHKICLQ